MSSEKLTILYPHVVFNSQLSFPVVYLVDEQEAIERAFYVLYWPDPCGIESLRGVNEQEVFNSQLL